MTRSANERRAPAASAQGDGKRYRWATCLLLGVMTHTGIARAQQPGAPATQTLSSVVGYISVEGVTLSGPLMTAGGRATLGNNSTVLAGEKTATVTLGRGGSLRICASTGVHLSRDAAPKTAPGTAGAGVGDDAGLMLALDRGALEANYRTGRYSDVLLTPDLRILVSGPGQANLKLRVNRQGDTCIDNHGYDAPYVTVSSLMDGGVYRVQPNQRVLFEKGSLQQVVDREPEPCGCPDSPAEAPLPADLTAAGHVGGPSSTPADTAFPTAVSEGLKPPPSGPSAPVAPIGEPHAQVTATLSSDTPPGPPPPGTSTSIPPATAPAPAGSVAAPKQTGQVSRGFFHRIGHFFARIFAWQ